MAANENYVFGIKRKTFRNEKTTADRISNFIIEIIKSSEKATKPITILCIGSDRSTGDSLGPLVGMMLTENKIDAKIKGTLENPLHAENLRKTLNSINADETFVIAVDACLGEAENVGSIHVAKGPLKPGTGIGRAGLPMVGDLSISPVVNCSMDFMTLQSTRLATVYSLAQTVTTALTDAVAMVRTQEVDISENIV